MKNKIKKRRIYQHYKRLSKRTQCSLNEQCIGSSFDDFLREEGIYEEVHAKVIKRINDEKRIQNFPDSFGQAAVGRMSAASPAFASKLWEFCANTNAKSLPVIRKGSTRHPGK